MTNGEVQSLRAYLRQLEARGELWRVPEPVDRRFELAAWLAVDDAGPALLFERVTGFAYPVVANVANSSARLARALGVGVDEITSRVAAAVDVRHGVEVVSGAACHDVVASTVDLTQLPIPWFFEHETGPYITAGAVVAKDPDTGRRNFSIARIKALDASRGMIGIAPNHHLAVLARKATSRGERLPIAVTIGLHPALLIAAALYLELGEDELEHAGTLFDGPVQLARCLSVDLEVPAFAEFTLEGHITAGVVDEGPVSEFHGMYENYGKGAIVEFSALTHRKEPVFQVIEPGYHPEHVLLGGVAIAAVLRRALDRAGLSVEDVAVGAAGAGRLAATVALRSPGAGDARRAAEAIWAKVSLIKHVTVVDADVDAWDEASVERARLMRSKPDRDIFIVPNARADRSEPLEADGAVAKWLIDATVRAGDRKCGFDEAAPPGEVVAAVQRRWRQTFGEQ